MRGLAVLGVVLFVAAVLLFREANQQLAAATAKECLEDAEAVLRYGLGAAAAGAASVICLFFAVRAAASR